MKCIMNTTSFYYTIFLNVASSQSSFFLKWCLYRRLHPWVKPFEPIVSWTSKTYSQKAIDVVGNTITILQQTNDPPDVWILKPDRHFGSQTAGNMDTQMCTPPSCNYTWCIMYERHTVCSQLRAEQVWWVSNEIRKQTGVSALSGGEINI